MQKYLFQKPLRGARIIFIIYFWRARCAARINIIISFSLVREKIFAHGLIFWKKKNEKPTRRNNTPTSHPYFPIISKTHPNPKDNTRTTQTAARSSKHKARARCDVLRAKIQRPQKPITQTPRGRNNVKKKSRDHHSCRNRYPKT